MTYYYVDSPVTGMGGGQYCYCKICANGTSCNSNGACTPCGQSTEGCPHDPGFDNLCCPVDIEGAANAAARFYARGGIPSIRVTWTGPCPCPPNNGDRLCRIIPPLSWVNEGVKVELFCQFDGAGTLIGVVGYGHLRYRINPGVYNYPDGLILGYLGDQDCRCDCYRGIHIHMARSTGYTYPWGCGTTYLYMGASPVYRFDGPPVCAG